MHGRPSVPKKTCLDIKRNLDAENYKFAKPSMKNLNLSHTLLLLLCVVREDLPNKLENSRHNIYVLMCILVHTDCLFSIDNIVVLSNFIGGFRYVKENVNVMDYILRKFLSPLIILLSLNAELLPI